MLRVPSEWLLVHYGLRPCLQVARVNCVTACAYADDFALAKASLLESLPTIADACTTIDTVTGMFLNHKTCHWIQCENVAVPLLSEWVGTQSSGKCRSRIIPSTWALT